MKSKTTKLAPAANIPAPEATKAQAKGVEASEGTVGTPKGKPTPVEPSKEKAPRVSNLVGREIFYRGKWRAVLRVAPSTMFKGNNAYVVLDDGSEFATAETYARTLFRQQEKLRAERPAGAPIVK